MSTTPWPQLPPDPISEVAAEWERTPRTPADLVRIRRELSKTVRDRPWPTDDDLEQLLLIVDELASNGLRHGRPPVRVRLTTDLTGWLLDVSDAAPDRPPTPACDRDPATGGLGLHLVARLSAAHGWTVHGERKHVWARIASTAERCQARIRGTIDDRAAELGFLPALRLTGPVWDLTDDMVTDLLAVLREALDNVARHARADSAHVAVAVTGDDVTVRVRDDGVGLAAAPKDGGLADLRRRAAWHGGRLTVQPEPAGGTRLTWTVPRPSSGQTPRPES